MLLDTKKLMKKLEELSKQELISLIRHQLADVDWYKETLVCAMCGQQKAKFHYECDACNKENEEWHKEKFTTHHGVFYCPETDQLRDGLYQEIHMLSDEYGDYLIDSQRSAVWYFMGDYKK